MPFVLVLAILLALAVSEHAPAEPVSSAGYRLGVALLGMMLVVLFAVVASGGIASRLRRSFERHPALLRQFKGLRRAHAVLWLAVAGGILYGLGWAQLVRFNWHLDRTILADDLLILAPILLPMVLSWAAFYEVDRAVRLGLSAGDPSAVVLPSRGQYLGLHLRHYLGILLLPVLGLLAIQDATEVLLPGILETGYAPAVYVAPILLLFVLFPWLLRHVWQTSPLEPGPLRSRLEAATRRGGFRVREILVWHTGGMVVNAAVAGLVSPLRYVLLTDGLLARLTDEEIEGVFGHEMGHIRHHHLLLRVLAMVAPLSLYLLVQQAFPEAVIRVGGWLDRGALGLSLPPGLLMVALMAAYALLVFGGYSRLLEAQADLSGCRTLARDGQTRPVQVFSSALEKLAAAGAMSRSARTWLHGSVARRVDFVNRAAQDPMSARRFERRVWWLGGLLTSIVLSPLLYGLLRGLTFTILAN